MNLIKQFLSRPPDSAQIAKQRLQLVLAHDRADITPDEMERLKDEIKVEVSVWRGTTGNRLIADIPVLKRQKPSDSKAAPSTSRGRTSYKRKAG